jgi:mono/diheme cytochrome c family protein
MSTEYQPPIPPEEHHLEDNAPDAPDYSETVDVAELHGLSDTADEKIAEPIPLWLVVAVLLIGFWSGAYLIGYSGGFDGNTYNSNFLAGSGSAPAVAGAKTANGAAPATAAADPIALGKRFFTQTCVACHQTTGLGQAGAYPPLAGSEYVQGDEKRLAAIVLHGVQGQITVNGSTVNSQMQAWGPQLDDKRISYILTYIRQEWGNKAGAVSPDVVATMRKATAAHEAAWTEAELKAFK